MSPILEPGVTCGPLVPVRDAWVVVDARDFYRAFVDAAERAERAIFMAGWQFDSQVQLLRGAEAHRHGGDLRLLPFLEGLCRRRPELDVYILAWDYSSVFGLEREWFQDLLFAWRSGERIRFRYDDVHSVGASHHQKLVCIDAEVAFVGGMDICSARWDRREHEAEEPLRRDVAGAPYEPHHDVQACVTGEAAREAARIFAERWTASQGEPLALPPPTGAAAGFAPRGGLRVRAGQAAFSRTVGRTLVPPTEPVQEVRRLYERAIAAADSLVYLENQYFSSHAVFAALVRRMRDPRRPRLQVVLVLPREPHAAVERVAMGETQDRMLALLRTVAREGGHALGVFSTRPARWRAGNPATYIHAKLLVVDDRLLSVGSANTNNRGMGLDTELNVSFEDPEGGALGDSIAALRVDLLREHAGLDPEEARPLAAVDGLVDRLVALSGPDRRLSVHAGDPAGERSPAAADFEGLSLDPDGAVIEEGVLAALEPFVEESFARGIPVLRGIGTRVRFGRGRAGAVARFFLHRRVALAAAAAVLLAWLVTVLLTR